MAPIAASSASMSAIIVALQISREYVAELTTAAALLELEERLVRRAVIELHDQFPALAFPSSVGLPDVGVLIRSGIVREAAAACRDCLLDDADRRGGVTGDLLRGREARRENPRPLGAAQAELDRDGAASLHHVHRWWVVNGREETGEGITLAELLDAVVDE